MITVYGDSHASQFRGHDGIKVFSTNSVPLHTLTSLDPLNPYVGADRPAVLVFGEIDVRCLIHPQIEEKGRDEEDVLLDLINRFAWFYHNLGDKVIICSITPASSLVKKTGMDGYPGWQPGFWKRQGTLEDRIRYTATLNRYFREIGPFLDIHDHYADPSGQLQYWATQDGVHICPTQNAYMVEELRKML